MTPKILRYPVDAFTRDRCERFWADTTGRGFWTKYPERWRWLYRDGAMSVVVEDGETIAGHLGCVPIIVSNRGTRARWGMDLDLFVQRPYRRQGHARALEQRLLAEHDNLISLWHSEAMLAIKLSLGLEIAVTVPVLTRRPDVRNGNHGRALATTLRCPDPAAIARAASTSLSAWDWYVERTEAYCAWRFVDQPHAAYRQLECEAGLALVRLCGVGRPGHAMIGDGYPVDPSIACACALTRAAAGRLLAEGCAAVRFATADRMLAEALIAEGWDTSEHLQLVARPGTITGRVFVSLSDHDVDQYPW